MTGRTDWKALERLARTLERVERERAAEALIAKLEQRPLVGTVKVGERDAVIWTGDAWRAFYGDPLVSDEELNCPEMSGMDLYREHTGHGEGS